jgi:hypothetical protein
MMAADMPPSVVVVAGGTAVVLSDDFGALLYAEAATVGLVVDEAAVVTAMEGVVVTKVVVSGAYTKLSLELSAS